VGVEDIAWPSEDPRLFSPLLQYCFFLTFFPPTADRSSTHGSHIVPFFLVPPKPYFFVLGGGVPPTIVIVFGFALVFPLIPFRDFSCGLPSPSP